MAQANTHPWHTPPVSPPQTALHGSATSFIPNKGKGKASPENDTRLQLVFPEQTAWSRVLSIKSKKTPVAAHLRQCHHWRKGWEEIKFERGEEKVYQLGYSESQDCKRHDRYWTIPPSILPDYTARHFSRLQSKEERQLDVFGQILADINPVVKKFHHYQQAIAEAKSAGRKGKEPQRDMHDHTECQFSQLQAYHGAGSMSDEVEYWQIHVLGKKQWYDMQERLLKHALVEEHSAVGGIIEDLARMRHRNRLYERSGDFFEEQGVEFGALVRGYLLINFRGFLPDDRPALGWDATGNVTWFGCTPGGNASILSDKPDAKKAADSYEHQAALQRGAW